ncbi:hypothetical protein WBJ53_10375 [Spirosoma sp. SC4-14]|uniref:hypothetical protein n=1 Tax=Spirosoma sp. SC4-14 TaxID=3128900 RepID=UPI0030D38BC8
MNTIEEYNPPVRKTSRRIILFKLISILFSLLILCFLEVLLRVVGYGYDMSLFVDYPENGEFLVLNPNASKNYFLNQKIATTGNIEPFKKKKDPNTCRIFVLGESTTIGYPYFHNGSFHRWLQYRLTHTFPDKNFEIINLSLTAVNSYCVLGFAREVVEYEPDAVLIYTGHNEYYGALGVGSTEQIGGSPSLVHSILKLRKLRLAQLLVNTYEHARHLITPDGQPSGGTRMKLMVAEQQIPYQSELYERGVEQFRANMDQTLGLLNEHTIPVFVSNLVSNEKDLKPFVSFPVDSQKFPGFVQNYSRGVAAFNRHDYSLAYTFFKAANQSNNTHALCTFYLGKTAYELGNFGYAKAYFARARDLDGLRFRAPGSLNGIIEQLCSTYKTAHLVDTKEVFEAHSTNKLIGDELILEHVHPDLMGYALLSEAFYTSLKAENFISPDPEKEMSFEQLLHNMPITKVDSLAGIYKVANLKRNWPFKEVMKADSFSVTTVEEKLAYDLTFRQLPWLDALSDLYDHYMRSRQLANARKVLETLVLEYPTDARYAEKAAMLSGELKDEETAVFYFKKAFALAPSFDRARYLIALTLQLDRPQEAMPYLDYAIQHNTTQFNLGLVRGYAERVIELKRAYQRDSANLTILNQIADAYFRMDNKSVATRYVQKVLKVDADNQGALSLMAHLR